jgi:hypothetical protein
MKILGTLLLSFSFFMCITLNAQSKPFELPANYPPTEKSEYIKFKADFLNGIKWLEETPFNEQGKSRKKANAFIVEYLTNSPDISVAIDGTALKVADKNSDLLVIYMGGYARLAFESQKGKQDQTQCVTAALKSIIKYYKANIDKGLKKDKNILKLIAADEQGELEKWIKDNTDSK